MLLCLLNALFRLLSSYLISIVSPPIIPIHLQVILIGDYFDRYIYFKNKKRVH